MVSVRIVFTITNLRRTWQTRPAGMARGQEPEMDEEIKIGAHTYRVVEVNDAAGDAVCHVWLACGAVSDQAVAERDILDGGPAVYELTHPVSSPLPLVRVVDRDMVELRPGSHRRS